MRFREKAVGVSFYREGMEVALEWPAEQPVSRTGPPDTEARVPQEGNSGGTTENFRPELMLGAFFYYSWN